MLFDRRGGAAPTGGEPPDMTFYILAALYDEPGHGYDVIEAIAHRRGFRPRPETIYPTLQLLEDTGAIRCVSNGDPRRVYALTDDGSALLADTAGGGAAREASAS